METRGTNPCPSESAASEADGNSRKDEIVSRPNSLVFLDVPKDDSVGGSKEESHVLNPVEVILSSRANSEGTDENTGEISDPRPHKCKFCGRRFSTFRALGGHQNAHRVERQRDKRRQAGIGVDNPHSAHFSHRPLGIRMESMIHKPSYASTSLGYGFGPFGHGTDWYPSILEGLSKDRVQMQSGEFGLLGNTPLRFENIGHFGGSPSTVVGGFGFLGNTPPTFENIGHFGGSPSTVADNPSSSMNQPTLTTVGDRHDEVEVNQPDDPKSWGRDLSL